jgi:hypothetical protein
LQHRQPLWVSNVDSGPSRRRSGLFSDSRRNRVVSATSG